MLVGRDPVESVRPLYDPLQALVGVGRRVAVDGRFGRDAVVDHDQVPKSLRTPQRWAHRTSSDDIGACDPSIVTATRSRCGGRQARSTHFS
jgi:hypothetical protein